MHLQLCERNEFYRAVGARDKVDVNAKGSGPARITGEHAVTECIPVKIQLIRQGDQSY